MKTGRRPRILYVDDNSDVTDSAVELLRLLGYETVASYDASHALTVAPAFRPDVCLLDLNMPGVQGDELARRLRVQAGGRSVLFVGVTARSDDVSIRRMADAGVGLLFVKPADPHDLVRVIEDHWSATKHSGG